MSIPGYDSWKTRAPEDEPGYWDDKEPEPGECDHNPPCSPSQRAVNHPVDEEAE